jgi:hypothetical protein
MNRKLFDVLVLVALCLALAWCVPSLGQVLKGSISGTVADPQGAVVSNAQVKATQTGTGNVLTTKSDNAGLFRFNLIPTGNYKVEVSAPSFKTAMQDNVLVSAGHDSDLGSIHLTLGETSTTVEVTAAAPLIDTTQAQVTNTFSGATLQTFAGIQENQGLDSLALFVPGVASARDNNFSNTNGGMGFSTNGLRGRNNDQQVDGQNNNDNSVGGPAMPATDPEFVSQYVLITNQFGPEYGRNSGSVVNVITKSGTNVWHGSVFASENNSLLNSLSNANKNPQICGSGPDSTCLTKNPRLNDEFGGFTIGGPLVKNKAFLFSGLDEEIISGNNILQSGNLTPTPAGLAVLAACFPSGIGNAAVNAVTRFGPFGVSGGNPVVSGNPSPFLADGVTPVVAACPTATFAGVSRTVAQPFHQFNWITRTDFNLGNNNFTARYFFVRGNSFNTDTFATGASGYPADVLALAQQGMMSWTRNLSPRMVNEARTSFGRTNVEFGGNSYGNTVPNDGHIDQALANVIFRSAGLLGFGPATNAPQGRIVNTWQAQDNWSFMMGRHQLKAGVNWTYQRSPNIFLPNLNGAYRFTDWNGFFANTPQRIRIAEGPSQLDFREYDTFVYGGDEWKISQSLSLTMGLTWSYYGQPANLFNTITTARESNPATAFWGSTEPFGNPPGSGGPFLNPGAAIPLSARTFPQIPAPKNSFGPSVGFAYSPQWGGFLTGHGKTVFRGGYRLLYDPPFYNIYVNISTSAPEALLQTVAGPSSHPMPAAPFGPAVRTALASALQLGVYDPRTFSQTQLTPNFGPDKVHSWSLGIERELTKNAAIEARYVGNHGGNLFQTLDSNPFIADLKTDFPNLVPAGLTPCPSSQAFAPVAVGRVDCNNGIGRVRTNSAFSNYNGLQMEFRANNLFKQLTVRSAYTYSKNLDNVSEIFSTLGGGNSVFFAQNPANQVKGPGEYSFSGLDYPQTWTILFTEQLPFFKEQHGLVGHIFGGWGLSANYQLQSGQRYNPTQIFEGFGTAAGNYYDLGYINAFASFDPAHTFLGNLNAPATSVGIFAGDACNVNIGLASGAICATPTQLLDYGTLNKSGSVVGVTKDQVRFIVNAAEAQTIFGTPFGNTPRNPVQDAITNIASASIIKNIKIKERTSFEFHATFFNVFNHQNFLTVDPLVTDAGLSGIAGLGTGFGDPKITDTTYPGSNNATRRITLYGVFRF